MRALSVAIIACLVATQAFAAPAFFGGGPVAIPTAHVEVSTPVGTTSETFEDVTGSETTVTFAVPSYLVAIASFQLSTISGASASTIEINVNIDGVDQSAHARSLSGTSDTGIGAISHRSDTVLAAGVHTVKLTFRRTAGVATPGIDNAYIVVFGLPQ